MTETKKPKYKLYGIEEGETLYMGNMRLHDYLRYLSARRHFNEELIIEHTKWIYGIDLTDILNGRFYFLEYKKNLYHEFQQNNKPKKLDDGTRKYFNTYGRNYYLDFMSYAHFTEEDCLSNHSKYLDVHHIYPLMSGGDSRIENLIHLSEFNHNLIHENPLEQYEIYCHKAVDYLGYLYGENQVYDIIVKYELAKYGVEMFFDMFPACIKQEMKSFYNTMLKDYESHRTS